MLSEAAPGPHWRQLSSVLYSSLVLAWLSSRSVDRPFWQGQQVNGHRNLDVTRGRTSTRRRTSTQSEKSKMADIAIVGGGPSGAMCGAELARAGHTVNIFDQHLAWEKPCGGGLTHKAIQNFPFLLDNPYPKKLVNSVELISSNDHRATLDMTHPI